MAHPTPVLVVLLLAGFSSIAAVAEDSGRSENTPEPFLTFEGHFTGGGQPTRPTQIIPLDSEHVWFVLEATVDKVVEGALPEDWSRELVFGVHSPALFFHSQSIRLEEGYYVPSGRFVFELWQSRAPPYVLRLNAIPQATDHAPPEKAL